MTSAQWRAAGAALEALDRLSVLLIVGDAPVSLAATVRGAADAGSSQRRVAIFDLAGAFGTQDDDGVIAAFRNGRSLNALARPLSDGDERRFIVPRGPGELDEPFARHERWPKLVAGFRDTGALLIIAAPADFHALPVLAGFADHALYMLHRDDACRLVPWPPSDAALFDDTPPAPFRDTVPAASELREDEPAPAFASDESPRSYDDAAQSASPPIAAAPVTPPPGSLAQTETREPVPSEPRLPWSTHSGKRDRASTRKSPPPLVRITPASPIDRVRSQRRISWIVAGIMIVLSIGGWYWAKARGPLGPNGERTPSPALASIAGAGSLPDSALVVPPVINPQDSIRSAAWGVELVTTNDRADAVARVAGNGNVAATTISPMVLGADGSTWYKVIVGAYLDRTGAEYMRATLRRGGAIDENAGVVARSPYAFRLDHGLSRDAAKARVVRYVARGIAAYALLDDSTHASIYAGAFASPDQAVILLAELKAAGVEPVLAYRVGRTF